MLALYFAMYIFFLYLTISKLLSRFTLSFFPSINHTATIIYVQEVFPILTIISLIL